jgi:hypothetical protein
MAFVVRMRVLSIDLCVIVCKGFASKNRTDALPPQVSSLANYMPSCRLELVSKTELKQDSLLSTTLLLVMLSQD